MTLLDRVLGRMEITLRLADLRRRLAGPKAQHEVVLDLTQHGDSGRVIIDGNDVSSMLRGVELSARVGELTELTLDVAPGQQVAARARLSASQLYLRNETDQREWFDLMRSAAGDTGVTNALSESAWRQLTEALARRHATMMRAR